MIRVIFCVATSVFLYLLQIRQLEAETLTIATGDGRPYIFFEQGQIQDERPGFSIEILMAVAKVLGWKLNFEVMPFSRQLIANRAGQVDGHIATFKSDAPDLIFPAEPIGVASNCFFALRGSAFRFPSRVPMDKFKIGVTNGFTYGLIDQYIEENAAKNIVSLSGEDKDVLLRLIDMLLERRIDTFIDADPVVRFHLKERQISELENVGCTTTFDAFIAFSPNKPESKERVKKFDKAVSLLRSSGELQQILDRYGAKDWR